MNDLSNIEITLVEDDPNDAELTMRALKKNHLVNNLVWLTDGAEALDYFFARGKYSDKKLTDIPKVVLLDLKLPKISGLEVLEKIRSYNITKSIPVVVLTSSNEEKDIMQTYKLGVNSYIVKPVEFEKYEDAIAELGAYWLTLNKPPF
jgi:two-component system, response regulator